MRTLRLVRLWRSSLSARTILITAVLAGGAVTIVGVVISGVVRGNLFDSRLEQAISDSARVVLGSQQLLTTAAELGESADVVQASSAALDLVRSSSTASYTAFLRMPGQEIPRLVDDQASRDFLPGYASAQLRGALLDGDMEQIVWQSVSLAGATGDSPGITTGAILDTITAGRYQLFLVYDLQDAQNTLGFVQSTLLFAGLVLVFLFVGVAYLVVRVVVYPIRVAADTSEKLASGALEERLVVRGEDEVATLATSFNRMADSLQTQIRQLAELSRVQQRFVSDVSHELRTPLTTIRLASEVLYDQRGDFAELTARTSELLHAQVQRFETMLADLLEMSRYDAGAVELEKDLVSLVHLVEESLEAMSPLAKARGSEIRLVATGGYVEVQVDARRIRRILQNLLGNAIDHGEGDPILVYVDSDEHAVAIVVRDYGVGMTQDQLERVFDRFWRADPSRQRSTGGTGLGLAISLEDAGAHGGELEVFSAGLGLGSSVRLTLPRRQGEVLHGSPLALPPDDEDEADG